MPHANSPTIRRVILSPTSLAVTALKCSTRRAVIIGSSVCAVECGLVVGPLASALGEGYPNIANYAMSVALAAAVVSLVVWMPILGAYCGIAAYAGRAVGWRREVIARIIMLCPLSVLIPFACWSALATLKLLAPLSFGLGTSKPAWVASTPVQLFGSYWWVIAFVLCGLWVSRLAARRLNRFCIDFYPRICDSCEYLLLGLSNPRCPECGAPFEENIENESCNSPR